MASNGQNENDFFIPLRRKHLSDEIYTQLKEAILSGRYKLGERLPSEKALCETFKVGRAVIREALRQLENVGLIYVRLGSAGGRFAKQMDSSTLLSTFEGIVRLNNVSLEELTKARAAIEAAVFDMAVQVMGDHDLKELESSIQEARHALKMGIEEPKNVAFHVVLAKITQNKLLIGIIESLLELQNKFTYMSGFSHARKKRFIDEHQQVLELLKARKYKQAQRFFEEHISNSMCLFINPH